MLYNESGKFQVSKPDFKDFVIKMKKLINENSKDNPTQNQNNMNLIENNSNEKANKKTSKKIVSMKNNSRRFVFTLNGENEKCEKKTNNKEQLKREEKREKSESTKKDIIQKKRKINKKTKKIKNEEENEMVRLPHLKKKKLKKENI